MGNGRNSPSERVRAPLQMQFAMRKAELEAQELTWDQLYAALLNLYHRRMIEWQPSRTSWRMRMLSWNGMCQPSWS
jgi:hypothetical protein